MLEKNIKIKNLQLKVCKTRLLKRPLLISGIGMSHFYFLFPQTSCIKLKLILIGIFIYLFIFEKERYLSLHAANSSLQEEERGKHANDLY